MARWRDRTPHNQSQWEQAGCEALLDLVSTRLVIPWHEAEARISSHGWNGFPKVQPLQLNAARKQLLASGDLIAEKTQQSLPVTTLRIPFPPDRKREIERLRGARRKLYRKYLSWTQDQALCGKHAESIVLQSIQSCASAAGLWVPPQAIGDIQTVMSASISPQTLDVLVHVLDLGSANLDASVVIEVKNIHGWVYPWAPELWELLAKAAVLASKIRVLPVFVCPRAAYPTWQMAQDTGFFTIQTTRQIFHPAVPEEDFDAVVNEFALLIERFDDIDEHVASFFTRTMRRSQPVAGGTGVEWYAQQIDRFTFLASTFRRFASMAASLPHKQRAKVWKTARGALKSAIVWPQVSGW